MDIGHQWNTAALADLRQGASRLFVGHGTTHDITTGSGQPLDLSQGRRDIAGVGTAHGLNGDRRTPTDGEIADQNLTGLLGHVYILLQPPMAAGLSF